MKRKFKWVCAILAMILCVQGVALAAENPCEEGETAIAFNMDGGIQPYGLYLMRGGYRTTGV